LNRSGAAASARLEKGEDSGHCSFFLFPGVRLYPMQSRDIRRLIEIMAACVGRAPAC
jgi:hypothetical protein